MSGLEFAHHIPHDIVYEREKISEENFKLDQICYQFILCNKSK